MSKLRKAIGLIDGSQICGYVMCFGLPACVAAGKEMYWLGAGIMLGGAAVIVLINLERVCRG